VIAAPRPSSPLTARALTPRPADPATVCRRRAARRPLPTPPAERARVWSLRYRAVTPPQLVARRPAAVAGQPPSVANVRSAAARTQTI